MTVRHDDLRVTWYGYATARVESEDGTVAYTDPGRYGVLTGEWTPPGGGNPKQAAHPRATDHRPMDADLVVVTHDHHYDSEGIERVAADDATVVVYEGVDAARIDRDVTPVDDLPFEVVRVGEADHVAVDGVGDVWSMPAYNEPDGPHAADDGSVPHPEGFGVGYRFTVGAIGTSVFWPGDSDALDAFAELDVSLFLANISGSVCMGGPEAADLTARMDPDLVVPIHYNTQAFLEADSAGFASDVAKRTIPVALDESTE
ncbi:MBL fold metallo-hydrolase [Halobaculum gomorrense]|uniref:L-ascorbate metabolism protein UlaG, beta-lactamase superfamily n=1 Tax=Halobaculum gomorrense TaxID=43928 RepID=A0A1M5RFG7_9EURY|nr:MBL fold metallo-hydrolase [Halobaculum gomorrense]SHH25112.1 L-ascorbate metabolism protein UlaG, beta-lactamase superfamily [Halobaculum gomorrense]